MKVSDMLKSSASDQTHVRTISSKAPRAAGLHQTWNRAINFVSGRVGRAPQGIQTTSCSSAHPETKYVANVCAWVISTWFLGIRYRPPASISNKGYHVQSLLWGVGQEQINPLMLLTPYFSSTKKEVASKLLQSAACRLRTPCISCSPPKESSGGNETPSS